MDCYGCALGNDKIEVRKVYESLYFNVILDIDPINPGHLLIIPKKHVEQFSDLNNQEIKHLQDIIKKMQGQLNEKLNYSNFSIWINEGEINDLKHLHIHLIPRDLKDHLLFSESKLEKIELDHVFKLLSGN
jgi:diadenosine tetraphosphate (Ap4A) HIT family hydrolase